MIIGLSVYSAEDVISNIDTTIDNEQVIDEISNKDSQNLPTECCSFVIQEENNETVFSFRQDSPMYEDDDGIIIESGDWDGHKIIKQKVNSKENYFFHAIIIDNGWVIGEGGSQYNDASRSIEKITLEMVKKDKITTADLNKIKKILKKNNYGHVLIKAPDGRYGAVVQDKVMVGKLEPGQYLIAPNEKQYIKMGNYKDYNNDPVQAIMDICSYDKSGENTRDQMIYHYRPENTFDGMFYGVDVYVTNCNGKNIGLDKASCVVPFYYNGLYYPTSLIPEYPEKLYVATEIFKDKPIKNIYELSEPGKLYINK